MEQPAPCLVETYRNGAGRLQALGPEFFKVAICDLKESARRKSRRHLTLVVGGLLVSMMCHVAQAVMCSQVSDSGNSFVVCRAEVQRDDLRVFLRDAHGQTLGTFDELEKMLGSQGKRLAFAMNAGMFHVTLEPVGLLIEDGKEIVPVNIANGAGNFFLKPNGVFFIDGKGAHVVESSKFAAAHAKASLATQSGPLLVEAGAIHPKFSASSKSLYIRNGVGIDAAGTIVFAASDAPLTLYDFAIFYRDVLHCPDALYLDGSVSSVYAPSLGVRIQRADLGPIVAVVESKPGTDGSQSADRSATSKNP